MSYLPDKNAIYLTGYDGPGQASGPSKTGAAYVGKFVDGNPAWRKSFETSGVDVLNGLAVDESSGTVVSVGSSGGDALGGANAGKRDAVIWRVR